MARSSQPESATLENYRTVFSDQAITSALLTTVVDRDRRHDPADHRRRAGGYAFAWLDFPGRDWLFVVVVACSSCRCKWR